jgi:hypothetical protein
MNLSAFPVQICGAESGQDRDRLLEISPDQVAREIFHSQFAAEPEKFNVTFARSDQFVFWLRQHLGSKLFLHHQSFQEMSIGIEPGGVEDLKIEAEDADVVASPERVATEHDGKCSTFVKRRNLFNDLRQGQFITIVAVDRVQTGRAACRVVRLLKEFELQTSIHG